MGPIPFFMNCGCHTMLPLLMPLPPICPICPIGLPLPIFPIPLPMPPIMFIMGAHTPSAHHPRKRPDPICGHFLMENLVSKAGNNPSPALEINCAFLSVPKSKPWCPHLHNAKYTSEMFQGHFCEGRWHVYSNSQKGDEKLETCKTMEETSSIPSWKHFSIFLGGLLYIISVYFTWYICLYRAKPQKKQFPYLPNFDFLRAIHIRSIKSIQKLHPPKGCLFGGLLHVSYCLSAEKSPAMDNWICLNQPKSSINPQLWIMDDNWIE